MVEVVPFAKKGFVRLPVVLRAIPVGKSTWWAGVKSGKYPKAVKLGKNTTAWRVEDIERLLDSLGDTCSALEQAVVRPHPQASNDNIAEGGSLDKALRVQGI